MDRPEIPEQVALWFSTSKGCHIPISDMIDRHLLGAIGSTQKFAKWQWEDAENPDPHGNWHDYLPMNTYIPLVQECMSRSLDVPGEDDELFLLELSAKPRVEPSPCCCICEFRTGGSAKLVCENEDSEMNGTVRFCPSKCDKFKKK